MPHEFEMKKLRLLFILNPISGTNRKAVVLNTIRNTIDRERFDFDIKRTKRAGHAAELAREAAEQGYDIVVAVGGDGTVNEVARAIVHTDTALGIVPSGSGNGLARHLQIPLDTAGAVRIINEAAVRCLDYGRINGLPFFCTCGLGFDAFVSLKFSESGKRGPLSYVENTLREGWKYQPETYTLELDGETVKYKAFLIACANASQYGNNAYIAPHASMEDGLMDVIIMEPFNTIESPQIILQLFNKTLDNNTHVKTLQAKKVRITRPSDGVAHCDGDPFVTGKVIEVELINKSFNVVVNAHAEKDRKTFTQTFNEFLELWSQIPTELIKTREDLKRINRNILDRIRKF